MPNWWDQYEAVEAAPPEISKASQGAIANKAYAALLEDMQAYKRAGPLRGQLERFLELNRDTATGGFVDAIPAIGGFAANVGFNPKRGELAAISGAMQANDVPKGQGQVSNFERQLFALGTPGIDKKGTVNFNIAQKKLALFDEEGARLKFMEDWWKKHGDLAGASDAWDRRLTSNPYYATTPDGSVVYAKSQAEKLRDRKKRIDAARGRGGAILSVEEIK